ncbi:hypothetical protein [Bradyrhizobium sp. 150]|uniref:hypothetical protein n=1 Tax=Bradyrhizobium sp. 150 TaxID=2782625 RepID=UPI001FF89DF6|nr:hypothetical protein [Bradyrhizobium sp. 150]MCK1676792.1 hypothetical protein [Bradyrhizobium sp. 150]
MNGIDLQAWRADVLHDDRLWDVANEMDIREDVFGVYGIGEDGVQAFTDVGTENLIERVKFYKGNLGLLKVVTQRPGRVGSNQISKKSPIFAEIPQF